MTVVAIIWSKNSASNKKIVSMAVYIYLRVRLKSEIRGPQTIKEWSTENATKQNSFPRRESNPGLVGESHRC